MQISRVEIENFRSVDYISIDTRSICPIIGANNAGKSTILKSIEVFFDPAPIITAEDHHNKNINEPILITICFTNLTPAERKEFKTSLIDKTLTVTREVSIQDRHGEYAIYRRAHPAFQEFREEPSKTKKRQIYAQLRDDWDLPSTANADECTAALEQYEINNPHELQPHRVKGFLGAVNIANGLLRKRTNYIVVPAVKDGSDIDMDKKSPVLSLLNTITKQTLENKKELQDFLEDAKETLKKLSDPKDDPNLKAISSDITNILHNYYNDAEVEADWDNSEILQINYPKAEISVSHRGVSLPIPNLGHGLQRVIIFSVLQYLGTARQSNAEQTEDEVFEEPLSDIIIAIEEPEIYQHPQKQRRIYESIRSLVSEFDKNTGIRVQVIFTTHSEKLISLEDFDSIRLVKKVAQSEGFITKTHSYSLSRCSTELANLHEPPLLPFSENKLLASLHVFTDEISEGFFAEKIILVEGVSDRAVLTAAYLQRDRDPGNEGIAIIRTDGKTKLEKPALIFLRFGIPVFLVFDADKSGVNNNVSINKRLQRIVGEDNPQDYPSGCRDNYFSFTGNLNKYMEDAMGERADEIYLESSNYWI